MVFAAILNQDKATGTHVKIIWRCHKIVSLRVHYSFSGMKMFIDQILILIFLGCVLIGTFAIEIRIKSFDNLTIFD